MDRNELRNLIARWSGDESYPLEILLDQIEALAKKADSDAFSDEDPRILELEKKYPGIMVRDELAKCKEWCGTRKKYSYRRIINWLNNASKFSFTRDEVEFIDWFTDQYEHDFYAKSTPQQRIGFGEVNKFEFKGILKQCGSPEVARVATTLLVKYLRGQQLPWGLYNINKHIAEFVPDALMAMRIGEVKHD